MSLHKSRGTSIINSSAGDISIGPGKELNGREATLLALLAKAQGLPAKTQTELVKQVDGFAGEIAQAIVSLVRDPSEQSKLVHGGTDLNDSQRVALYFLEWARQSK